jgi:hypothetical protein
LCVQAAEDLLAGLDALAYGLLACLEGFVEGVFCGVLGGLYCLELLGEQADVGGVGRGIFSGGETGGDEPDEKGQDDYNQNETGDD